MNEWNLMYQYLYVLRHDTQRCWIERECPNTNAEGVKKWIDLMMIEASEYGTEPVISGGNDGEIIAEWFYDKQITEQDKKEAQEWLDAHPEMRDRPIKWRRNVPFNVDVESF